MTLDHRNDVEITDDLLISELFDDATPEEMAVLQADPEAWYRALVRLQKDLDEQLAARWAGMEAIEAEHGESDFERQARSEFMAWRGKLIPIHRRVTTRMVDVKPLMKAHRVAQGRLHNEMHMKEAAQRRDQKEADQQKIRLLRNAIKRHRDLVMADMTDQADELLWRVLKDDWAIFKVEP